MLLCKYLIVYLCIDNEKRRFDMNKSFPFKKRENPLSSENGNKTAGSGVREKYTATMDKELRKKVKIAAVEKGIVFSQYIEEAVMEKLEREGY
jgi:hypothetical protein